MLNLKLTHMGEAWTRHHFYNLNPPCSKQKIVKSKMSLEDILKHIDNVIEDSEIVVGDELITALIQHFEIKKIIHDAADSFDASF